MSDGPVILTIPAYQNSYSILQLDVYGNIFSTELSSNPPSGGGIYGFVESGSLDNLPDGVTRIELPYSFTTIAIRIDKYSSSGENHRGRQPVPVQSLDADPRGLRPERINR